MDVIDEMVKSIKELHDTSYPQYHLLAKDICSRNTSENEISHFLDDLLGICGDERFLKLFKQVCRHYYYKYPKEITFQVNSYFEWYQSDEEEN